MLFNKDERAWVGNFRYFLELATHDTWCDVLRLIFYYLGESCAPRRFKEVVSL